MNIEEFNKEKPHDGDKMKVTYLVGNQWAKSDTFIFQSITNGTKLVMVTLERVNNHFDEKRKCFLRTITIPLSHITKIKNYK